MYCPVGSSHRSLPGFPQGKAVIAGAGDEAGADGRDPRQKLAWSGFPWRTSFTSHRERRNENGLVEPTGSCVTRGRRVAEQQIDLVVPQRREPVAVGRSGSSGESWAFTYSPNPFT